MATSWIWQDGHWLTTEAARHSPLSHALHYGTGVFEGIRSYATPQGPRLFKLDEHLERLGRGAAALGLGVDLDDLRAACIEAVRRNGLGDAYVRPLVFWGDGPLTLDAGGQETHALVAALRWSSHLGAAAAEQGVRATLSPFRRNAARAIPPLKLTGAYVNAVLAKREAAGRGFEEAIFRDDEGLVCEATGENVFLVRDGRLIAAEHPDALPGITRGTLLELAEAEVRAVRVDELLAADEVFLTGTSAEVTPVREIDGRPLPVGPLTRRLQRLYAQTVRGLDATRVA